MMGQGVIFGNAEAGIGHVATAAGCFVTIIGIPLGVQHLEFTGLALAPIGKTIVDAPQVVRGGGGVNYSR